MMKETFRALETGVLAEVALFAFVIVFTAVVIRAFTMSKRDRDHGKNMPLDEPLETYTD